jgi:hypothetical protein
MGSPLGKPRLRRIDQIDLTDIDGIVLDGSGLGQRQVEGSYKHSTTPRVV